MRIAYILHGRFPTPKAYGKQVAEVCAALHQLKHTVTLLLPSMHNTFREDPAAYYGLPKKSFVIHTVDHADATRKRWIPGRFHLLASMFYYRRALRRYLRKHQQDLLYCRSPLVLSALLKTKTPVIIELHALPTRSKRSFARMLKRCRKVVCLTSPMKEELVKWGVPSKLVTVEPDGVDVERFANLPSSLDCKARWNLPSDVPIVGYVGTFVTQTTIEKGVRHIVSAFSVLQRRGTEFFGWIVGGPDKHATECREEVKIKNLKYLVQVEGHIPPASVPEALNACDVLIYPAPESDHPYFQRDTSPLKLFEYLAAGKPIVCADLPPLRDVVKDEHVVFVRPGDAEAIADAVARILGDLETFTDRAAEGMAIAERHSWKKRMARIVKV